MTFAELASSLNAQRLAAAERVAYYESSFAIANFDPYSRQVEANRYAGIVSDTTERLYALGATDRQLGNASTPTDAAGERSGVSPVIVGGGIAAVLAWILTRRS